MTLSARMPRTFLFVCTTIIAAAAASPSVQSCAVYNGGPPAASTTKIGAFKALVTCDGKPPPAGAVPGAAVAWASFDDGLLANGWGKLTVETSGSYADHEQMYGAGVVEGYLTAQGIHDNAQNLYAETFKLNMTQAPPKDLAEWFVTQDSWARASVSSNTDSGFWRQAGGIIAQFDGLEAGYAIAAAASDNALPPLGQFFFSMLNGIGDLFQIMPSLKPSLRKNASSFATRAEAEAYAQGIGHCSAIIRVAGEPWFEDLLFGHSSWFTYVATNRIFKHYHFDLSDASTASKGVSFSSYPGFLESLDDFYMLSSGLGWTQTSNGVYNTTLFDLVKPQSMLAWQRVRIASVMAHSGKEWWEAVKTAASGTYVNQYMIVDYNLFTPGKDLPANTLWVVEEIPGLARKTTIAA